MQAAYPGRRRCLARGCNRSAVPAAKVLNAPRDWPALWLLSSLCENRIELCLKVGAVLLRQFSAVGFLHLHAFIMQRTKLLTRRRITAPVPVQRIAAM